MWNVVIFQEAGANGIGRWATILTNTFHTWIPLSQGSLFLFPSDNYGC